MPIDVESGIYQQGTERSERVNRNGYCICGLHHHRSGLNSASQCIEDKGCHKKSGNSFIFGRRGRKLFKEKIALKFEVGFGQKTTCLNDDDLELTFFVGSLNTQLQIC